MELIETKYCCTLELTSLAMEFSRRDNHGRPADAAKVLLEFCRRVLPEPVKYRTRASTHKDALYSFYIMTESSVDPRPYAQLMAEFIEANKLGAVVVTGMVINEAFHPDHGNRLWIWTPDAVALRAWYEQAKVGQAAKDRIAREEREAAAQLAYEQQVAQAKYGNFVAYAQASLPVSIVTQDQVEPLSLEVYEDDYDKDDDYDDDYDDYDKDDDYDDGDDY